MKITRRFIKELGYDDMREFLSAFGCWAHGRDFTYQAPEKWTFRKMLKFFLKEEHDR